MRPYDGVTATLVIDADFAHRAASGGHARFAEETRRSLLGPAGMGKPDRGFGARFVEAAHQLDAAAWSITP